MTQISRGTEKLDLLKEAPKRKGYGWVCQALQSSTSAGDRCSVNMVDTVLMSVGRPIGWIFTSRDGHVLKKGEGKLNLDTIVKQFAKTSLSYSPNQNPSKLVLVVQEPDSSSNNFVPISQAMEYLRSPSSSAVSVQCFVPPRGGTDSGMFSNYRCEYLLDQYGRHVTRAFRLGVATGFATSNSSGTGGGSGAQTRSMVKSMDSSLNSTLSSHTMNIVRHVEKVKRCKVRKAHCDFVVDATGDVWFTRTSEMLTVQIKRSLPLISEGNRPSSAESAGPSHLARLKGSKKEGSTYGNGFAGGRRRHSGGGRPLSPPIGSEQLKRLTEKAEQPGGMAAQLRHARNTMAKPVEHMSGNLLLDANPQKKKLSSTTALGSSQREECIGDFCSYDVAVNFTEADAADEKDSVTAARRHLNTREVSSLMHRLGSDAEVKSGEPSPKTYHIPYYWVPRARAERSLVNLMLRRHKQGEKGDYLGTMDNTHVDSDVLGQNYPSHFYKTRVVCSSCFKVYKLIDVERDKAMDKLHRRQDMEKAKRLGEKTIQDGRASSPPRLLTGGSFSSSIRTSAWEGNHSNMGVLPPGTANYEGKQDAMSEGLRRAEQAIACLTKNDVAELRSFSTPPAAVMMVMKAVMLLLTGEIMDWKSSKRVMSNGERFLQMMGACIRDRERLPSGRIQKLRQKFTSNPNFHPDCVEPISRSAARFCAWVLGVVQFYSWSTGTAHPRIDPLRPYSAPGESGVEGDSSVLFPPVHESGSLASVYGTSTTTGLNAKSNELNFAEKQERGRSSKRSGAHGGSRIDFSPVRVGTTDEEIDGEVESAFQARGLLYSDRARSPVMPDGMPPTRERTLSPTNYAFGKHSSLPSAMSPVRTGGKTRNVDEFEELGATDVTLQKKPKPVKFTKKQKRARAKIQARQMARLAGGDEDGGRAVGSANGRNPLPIIIPCHRVIAKNGSLHGFGGGLKNKKILLDLEQSFRT